MSDDMYGDIIKNSIKFYFWDTEALEYVDEELTWFNAFSMYAMTTFFFGFIYSFLANASDFGLAVKSVGINLLVNALSIGFSVLIIYLIYLTARIFGGQSGTFSKSLKFSLVAYVAPLIILGVLSVLSIYISFFGILLIIAALIFFFFGGYIFIRINSNIFEISKLKTFFAILIVCVVMSVLFGVLMLLFSSILMAMIFTSL